MLRARSEFLDYPGELRRSQLQIAHPGQNLQPERFKRGQEIALLDYEPPLPLPFRAAKAAGALVVAKLQRLPERQQLIMALRGWRTEEEGDWFQPLWCGRIDAVSSSGIGVHLTHDRLDERDQTLAACGIRDFSTLHSPKDLTGVFESYPGLGVAPIPEGQAHAGRWLSRVAIILGES